MATSDLTYGHFRPDMPNVRSKPKNGVSNYRVAYQIIVASPWKTYATQGVLNSTMELKANCIQLLIADLHKCSTKVTATASYSSRGHSNRAKSNTCRANLDYI